ncbi:hypothetical protein HY947_02120 [Candidatus Gottesmanbacteria bacterium]|nr:hypothetical protein [Candidatus Gottesmanbacteria bacterium]
MASLTETAFYTRRTIHWGILGIIGYIILRIFWGVLVVVWLMVFPPKAPPPNHAFGVLPAIKFPEQTATPSGKLTFVLDTIPGIVPIASETAAVYFMPKNAANLLALTKTQNFAKRFEFDPTPIQDTLKNIYRFEDSSSILRKLRYDIVSNNFIVRYAFEQDVSVFTDKELPIPEAAISEARSIMQTNSIYPEDIASGTVSTTNLRLLSNRLIPTSSLSQADAIRIDFFRKSIGDMKIYTQNPDEGPISIIFSGSKNPKKRIIQFAYTFWPIEYQTVATYGLKQSAVAWQELQDGKGYIARYPKNGNTATVTNAYLGYYDSYDPETYLQPIFIFEGENGFLAYVSAVAPPWTE